MTILDLSLACASIHIGGGGIVGMGGGKVTFLIPRKRENHLDFVVF